MKIEINNIIIGELKIKKDIFKQVYEKYQEDLKKYFEIFAPFGKSDNRSLCNIETGVKGRLMPYSEIKGTDIFFVIKDIESFYNKLK